MNRSPSALACATIALALFAASACDGGTPVTVVGHPFEKVAFGSHVQGGHGIQLFGLTSDTLKRIYIGNNSNDTSGIPVQVFDPASPGPLPIALQDLGPNVGDADGIAYWRDSSSTAHYIFVPDRNEGLRRIAIAPPSLSSILPVSVQPNNSFGSPIIVRPSDGHLFLGRGNAPGMPQIEEYSADGVTHVASYPTKAPQIQGHPDVYQETMTLSSTADSIYFSGPFDSLVYVIDLNTRVVGYVGNAHGMIDGGLALDPRLGCLFVGTANGTVNGIVRTMTIPPAAPMTADFASGFSNSLGILREPISGDLYFLEDTLLWRLSSAEVDSDAWHVGIVKDVYNLSTKAADEVDLIVAGSYSSAEITAHVDGSPPFDFGGPVPFGSNTILSWHSNTDTIKVSHKIHVGFYTTKLGPLKIIAVIWKRNGVQLRCGTQVVADVDLTSGGYGQLLWGGHGVLDSPCLGPKYIGRREIEYFRIPPIIDSLDRDIDRHPIRRDILAPGPFIISDTDSQTIVIDSPPPGAAYAVVQFVVSETSNLDDPTATTDFVLMSLPIPSGPPAVPNVLILTDASGPALNGASHVSDLIAAFASTGANLTVDSGELTNGQPMLSSHVSGWDAVIVVTVTGATLDASDVPAIQAAVNNHSSGAFLFFTDACNGCTRGSAQAVLPILNSAGQWAATLGAADNSSYTGTLTGEYGAKFSAWPSISSAAYSPLVGVPSANVIYSTNAPASPGPCAVVAPGSPTAACVFMSTDVTQFWVTGGFSQSQANGLASAYLNAALACPLPSALADVRLRPTTGFWGIRSIAPNPSSRAVVVWLVMPADGAPRLDLLDIAGRVVRTVSPGRLAAGEHRITLPLSGVPGGVYFARLTGRGLNSSKKVVVVR